jgi:hypothetical protein
VPFYVFRVTHTDEDLLHAAARLLSSILFIFILAHVDTQAGRSKLCVEFAALLLFATFREVDRAPHGKRGN